MERRVWLPAEFIIVHFVLCVFGKRYHLDQSHYKFDSFEYYSLLFCCVWLLFWVQICLLWVKKTIQTIEYKPVNWITRKFFDGLSKGLLLL